MKQCSTCEKYLADDHFQFRKSNGTYRKSCRSCETIARKHRVFNPPSEEARKKKIAYSSEWQARQRLNPIFAAKIILRDSRNADKKANRENDLTEEFVNDLIKNGCSYCGDADVQTKMTADRIDNANGHTQDNVVASCYRCNMIRGNMPYDAWMNIVPAVKDTFQKGLFMGWKGFGPWSGLRKTTNVADELGSDPNTLAGTN